VLSTSLIRLVERLGLFEHRAREVRDRARGPGLADIDRARGMHRDRDPVRVDPGDDAELARPGDSGPGDPTLGVRDRDDRDRRFAAVVEAGDRVRAREPEPLWVRGLARDHGEALCDRVVVRIGAALRRQSDIEHRLRPDQVLVRQVDAGRLGSPRHTGDHPAILIVQPVIDEPPPPGEPHAMGRSPEQAAIADGALDRRRHGGDDRRQVRR
jgi:hypothetical protein